MDQLISRKLNELKDLAPENREYRTWLSDSNLWGWIFSLYKIRGQSVSKTAVVDMCSGTIREEIPLSCYSYVQNYKTVYSDMKEELSMLSAPDIRLFRRWSEMLFEGLEFRTSNPVVYEFGLIPCHFRSIAEELEAAFRKYMSSTRSPLDAAGILFLDIVRIYPYEDETTDTAMAMLLYCLTSLGLPVPELSVGEEEFGQMMKAYADAEDEKPFCEMLKRSVYNRLDTVVMLAKQAKENDDN